MRIHRAVVTPEARFLADITGVLTDLHRVTKNCHRIQSLSDGADPDLSDALSIAIVICYGRCFATGVRSRLPTSIVTSLPAELQLLHRGLLHLRNKHFAHSVAPFEENQVTVLLDDPPSSTRKVMPGVGHRRVGGFNKLQADRLLELAQAVYDRVDQLQTETWLLVTKQVEALGVEELLELPEPTVFRPPWEDVHLPRK